LLPGSGTARLLLGCWTWSDGAAVPSSAVVGVGVVEGAVVDSVGEEVGVVAVAPTATAPPMAANPATLAAPMARRVRRAGWRGLRRGTPLGRMARSSTRHQ
jgi:hypothetical protein